MSHTHTHTHTQHTTEYMYSPKINDYNLFADKLPTLKELTILKYTEKGEKRKFSIIEGASHKWKNIASVICDNSNKLSVLEQQYQGKPDECLRQIFINDFLNKKPQDYSQDWSGLIELLDDVGLETLAENVKQALSCT